MKIIIRMEAIDEDFIFEVSRRLEQEISNLDEIKNIDVPEIESGLLVILRVYPEADYIHPYYSKAVRSFRRKDKLLLVSSNMYFEDVRILDHNEVFNLYLDNVINSLFILNDKKIKGVDVEALSSLLKKLYK